MKVRFQISNHVYCLERETFYKLGDSANLSDHQAKTFIDHRLVEPFEYPIDEDEIKELYRRFTVSTLFEERVDIFLKVIAKSDSHIQLEDGTKLIFEVTPNKPEEWYYYNKRLIDFYLRNFYRCNLDRLKENFNRKLKNFAHFETLRKTELNSINNTFREDLSTGIFYWYKTTMAGEIPVDDKGTKDFLSKIIPYGLENYLQGKALAEFVEYLKETPAPSRINIKGKTKLFPEYLLTDDREILAEKIKTEFTTEKGKSIRLLIEVLIEIQLLTIENRGKKSFYNVLKEFFNRNIGSYPSIFDYKFDPDSDKEEFKSVKTKVNFILNKLKKAN